MTWELREVQDVEATLDDSGIYVVVHRIERSETHKEYTGVRILVRADLMKKGSEYDNSYDKPIVSFIGTANAVRKHLVHYIDQCNYLISAEHASYIGYELLRAETDPNYVQD